VSGVRRQVGDDAETNFWCDCWCGSVTFNVHFRRLFDLTVNKVVTIRNMFQLGLEVVGGVVVASLIVGLGGIVGRGV